MRISNPGDLASGGILAATGLAAALISYSRYDLGNPEQIGPGLFPLIVGAALALFGALLAISAAWREGVMPKIAWRPLLVLSGAMLLFWLTIDRFGILPSVVILILVTTFADRGPSLRARLLLAGTLAAMAVAVFHFAFGMPIPIIGWRL